LALFVLVAFGAVFMFLGRRTVDRDLLLGESARMRRLYVALAFYEEQYDSQPAPSLLAASAYEPNQLNYVSSRDPYVSFPQQRQGRFPIDPGIDGLEFSPFRISFSYLMNFVRAGQLQIKPWEQTRTDPKVGEIADEWLGSVEQLQQPYHAKVAGRILRVNTDGSVYVVKDRGGPKPLGDATDLFTKR